MEITVRVTKPYADGSSAQFDFVAKSADDAVATAAALRGFTAAALRGFTAAASETKAVETKPEVKKQAAATASSQSGAKPQSAAPKDDAPAVDPAEAYKLVKARILAVAQKSRDMTAAMLARFGVKNGTELKPDQYDELVAMADLVLADKLDPRDAITDDMA